MHIKCLQPSSWKCCGTNDLSQMYSSNILYRISYIKLLCPKVSEPNPKKNIFIVSVLVCKLKKTPKNQNKTNYVIQSCWRKEVQLQQLHSRYSVYPQSDQAKCFRTMNFVVLNRQTVYPVALSLSPCWHSNIWKK